MGWVGLEEHSVLKMGEGWESNIFWRKDEIQTQGQMVRPSVRGKASTLPSVKQLDAANGMMDRWTDDKNDRRNSGGTLQQKETKREKVRKRE